MALNPVIPAAAGLAAASGGSVSGESVSELFERLGLFGVLLGIGWFFWRRDVARSEAARRTDDDEIRSLKERISELEADRNEQHRREIERLERAIEEAKKDQ